MKEYYNKNFTDKGIKAFTNLLKELVLLYYTQTKYPFRIGQIVGVPYSNTGLERVVQTKQELSGRIKSLMLLLGLSEIRVEYGANEIVYKLGEKDE